MKLSIFTLYDKAVNAYLTPFFSRHVGEAMRSFGELANDPNHQVGKYPLDYMLVQIGEFDDTSGMCVTFDPRRVVTAAELVKAPMPDNPLSGMNLEDMRSIVGDKLSAPARNGSSS